MLRFEVLGAGCKFLLRQSPACGQNEFGALRSTPRGEEPYSRIWDSSPILSPGSDRAGCLRPIQTRLQPQQQIHPMQLHAKHPLDRPSEVPSLVVRNEAIAAERRPPWDCSKSWNTPPARAGTQISIGILQQIGTWALRTVQRSVQKLRLKAQRDRVVRRRFRP